MAFRWKLCGERRGSARSCCAPAPVYTEENSATSQDLSDTQWRIFRAALPALSIAAVGSGAALRLVRFSDFRFADSCKEPSRASSNFTSSFASLQVRAFAPNSLPIALVGLSAVFTGVSSPLRRCWRELLLPSRLRLAFKPLQDTYMEVNQYGRSVLPL